MLKKENLKLVSHELEEYWEGEMHSTMTFSIGPNITRKHLGECGITEGIHRVRTNHCCIHRR